MKKQGVKVCFSASSGGHLEQLLLLRPLMERYDSFLVTERTPYDAVPEGLSCHYLWQTNRREWSCLLRLAANTLVSLGIYLAERPDVIICTGALATIPLCLICKLFGKKLIFIESFAKVTSPTLTGRFLYRYADRFYIQWQQLQGFYPKAVFLGGIY